MVIFYMIGLPSFFSRFLSYETTTKFIISGSLLFPLGFFMGMPFPTGIRFVGRKSEEAIPWMWGLNSASSLLGSVSAVASAMPFGFSTTLLLGGLSYVAIFLLGYLRIGGSLVFANAGITETGRKKGREKRW